MKQAIFYVLLLYRLTQTSKRYLGFDSYIISTNNRCIKFLNTFKKFRAKAYAGVHSSWEIHFNHSL